MSASGLGGPLKVILASALFLALAVGAVAAVLVAWDFRSDDQAAAPPAEVVIPEDQAGGAGETAVDGTPLSDAPEPIAELPDEEPWPTFGAGRGRVNVARQVDLVPPFEEAWSLEAGSPLRFPPVVAYGRVFIGTDAGRVLALDSVTGEIAWEVDAGRCIAASPAADGKVVYVALMDPTPCKRHERRAPGFLLALDAATGEELWRFEAGVIESSPLVVNGRVYVGTWDDGVYAVDAGTGEELWSFDTDDRVRGGAAFRRNTIFVGSSDNSLYALNARTGELRWVADVPGAFRTTPSISRGRVYVGDTDGNVYAFDAETGNLVWSYATAGAVYGTPAVVQDTVYATSQAGTLYAIDAGNGSLRWSFNAGSPIPGSPMVMAGNVYFSTQAGTTIGLQADTGAEVWSFDDGRRSSLVTDGQQVYLAGARVLYALEAAPSTADGGGEPGPLAPEEPVPVDPATEPTAPATDGNTADENDVVSELAPVQEPTAAPGEGAGTSP